jgi:hypothetical protein
MTNDNVFHYRIHYFLCRDFFGTNYSMPDSLVEKPCNYPTFNKFLNGFHF